MAEQVGEDPQGGDGEPQSQGYAEDLEGLGADGSVNRGADGGPEVRSGAGAIEDQGGAGGKEKTNRARGTEGQGEAREV